MERTLNNIKGKQKIPRFISRDKQLEISTDPNIRNLNFNVIRPDSSNDAIVFDEEAGAWTLTIRKSSYVPIKAYKFLIKLALSFLPEDEIQSNYKLALDFVLKDNAVKMDECYAFVHSVQFGVKFPPHVYIFEKRNADDDVATHIMGFYFFNHIISIPLLFHKDDLKKFSRLKNIEFPPIFWEEIDINKFQVDSYIYELSSQEKRKDVKQKIIFKPNIDPRRADGFDPHTVVKFETEIRTNE